ncbi:MAG: hypothetical protein ABIN89_11270 [Chitinophagaceae bacterium]
MERNHTKLTAKNFSVRKSVLTALIIASTLFTASAGKPSPVNEEKEIAVTSMGVNNGKMVFNLKYANASEDKLSIILTDDRGMVLYKEIVDNKNVNKTFKTSAEVGTVILTVTNTKNKTKRKFEISNEKRYVEEVMITNVN